MSYFGIPIRNGLPIGLGSLTALAAAIQAWLPSILFANGEQGVWYDPSDLTTMFQDAAGTIPVTAVEQPVGRINDKSGRGNHASQSTATSRPVLSARVNLLTKTEDFGAWINSLNIAVSPNLISSPDGLITADKVIANSVNNYHFVKSVYVPAVAGVSYTSVVYAKAAEYTKLEISCIENFPAAKFDLTAVTCVGLLGSIATIQDVGNGWYKCSATRIAPSSRISDQFFVVLSNNSGQISFAGDGVSGIFIWGASLVPANQSHLPYQRVDTATDYDSVGFPHYLKFDGIDDSLATASINFTSTDKMTVVAGVRKLSGALTIFGELSANSTSNNGAFRLGYDDAGTAFFTFISGGTSKPNASTADAQYTSPKTVVFNGIGDISGDNSILRINGTQAATSSADQGTGNYGNYPIYIGARAGTQYLFNGHLYSLIVRGAQSTAAQITSAETYVNSKTGAY